MKILFLLVLICVPSVLAKNIEIKSISELGQYVDARTLVIFDLDNTVFQAARYDCHADRFYDQLKAGIDKRTAYTNWAVSQKGCPVKLVEERVRYEIQKLQSLDVQIIALTARGLDLEEITLEQLESLGIDFGNEYYSGVIFASPFKPKGEEIREFLKKSAYRPSKIVLVDDLVENLNSLEKEIPSLDMPEPTTFWELFEAIQKAPAEAIEFIGLHYPFVAKAQLNN